MLRTTGATFLILKSSLFPSCLMNLCLKISANEVCWFFSSFGMFFSIRVLFRLSFYPHRSILPASKPNERLTSWGWSLLELLRSADWATGLTREPELRLERLRLRVLVRPEVLQVTSEWACVSYWRPSSNVARFPGYRLFLGSGWAWCAAAISSL